MLLCLGLINERTEVHRCHLKKAEETPMSPGCIDTTFNDLDFCFHLLFMRLSVFISRRSIIIIADIAKVT